MNAPTAAAIVPAITAPAAMWKPSSVLRPPPRSSTGSTRCSSHTIATVSQLLILVIDLPFACVESVRVARRTELSEREQGDGGRVEHPSRDEEHLKCSGGALLSAGAVRGGVLVGEEFVAQAFGPFEQGV